MQFIQAWMRANRHTKIVLAVDSRNTPAIQLYLAYGFIETNRLQAWFATKP
jgi:ribosomal protein S18 acetylase RimI-like enzyme